MFYESLRTSFFNDKYKVGIDGLKEKKIPTKNPKPLIDIDIKIHALEIPKVMFRQ